MTPSGTGDLLERDGALDDLDGAVARARRGQGAVVLVAGEAGMGKSSVVDRWTSTLGRDEVAHVGWCDDLLLGRALGPFHDVARTAGGALADAVAAADTGAVLDATLALLADPLRTQVVVLEDVHWADEATLDVVRYVGRRIQPLGGLLVLTFRSDEVGPDHPLTRVLAALAGDVLVRIRLDPLGVDAVARILGDDGRDPQRVIELTGGNPFFVTELGRTGGTIVPTSVTETVTARLHRMPDATRRALTTLAVVTSPVSHRLASAVIGDLAVLAPAERRRLVGVDTDGIRFRHELVRRAIEQSMTSVEQVAAHRRVLEAMLEHGDVDPATVVHHALAASAADVVASHGPAAAARAVRAQAHRQAVELGARVLAVADRLPDAVVADLLDDHARSLSHLGRDVEAVTAAEDAFARRGRDDPRAQVRSALGLSRMRALVDDADGARDAMAAAVAAVAETDDDDLAADVSVARAGLHVRLTLLVSDDDVPGVLALTGAAVELADRTGRSDLAVFSRLGRGTVRTHSGDEDGGLAESRRAVEIGRRTGTPEPTGRAYVSLAEDLVLVGRWDEADDLIDEAIRFHADHGFEAFAHNARMQRAQVRMWQGRWDEVDRLLEAELVEEVPDALFVRTGMAVWRGSDDADALVDELWDRYGVRRRPLYADLVGALRIAHDWLQGRHDRHPETIARALVDVAPPVARGLLLRLLQLVGEPRHEPLASQRIPQPFIAALRGDWRAAADGWSALGADFLAALELASAPDPDAVIAGLATLDRLGAAPVATRARGHLRTLGVRSVPRGPNASTRANVHGLTERQSDVLALLAEGLTNAEIADRLVVSPRTVDNHVSAVLRKLGVTSRHEAVAAVDLTGRSSPLAGEAPS